MPFDHAVSRSMITKLSSKLFVANSFVEIDHYQWCPKDGTCFHLVSTVLYMLYRRSKLYQKMQRENSTMYERTCFVIVAFFLLGKGTKLLATRFDCGENDACFLRKDEFGHSYPTFP